MTTSRLSELLHERVADETPVDLSGRAWRTGRAVRRRRGLAVASGAAAGVVAVGGAVAWVGQPAPERGSTDRVATTSPTPTPAPTAEPTSRPARTLGATPGAPYRGADTWWLAAQVVESGLPQLDGTGLPEKIDLAPGAPPIAGTERAVALLGVVPEGGLSRVVAVGTDGVSRSLDVSRLERVTDEPGNVLSALTSESLAPDGTRAFFFQERSLEVYTFATGDWTTVTTPRWLAEGARWLTSTEIWVPDDLGGTGSGTSYDLLDGTSSVSMVRWVAPTWPAAEAFGPVVATRDDEAQAAFLSADATGPDGTTYGGLDAVLATHDDRTAALVLGPRGEWWKGCCPTVGFLEDTVLFEARGVAARVLAWDVGTERVRLVAQVVGWTPGEEGYVASWRVPLS